MQNQSSSTSSNGVPRKGGLLKLAVYVAVLFAGMHGLIWSAVIPFRTVPENLESRSPDNLKDPLESIVWGKSVLGQAGRHVVIIGPSTAFCAFPAKEMGALLPGYRVHDSTLNGITVKHSAKILSLLVDELPRERRKDALFVVAMYFGSFDGSADGRYAIADPLDGVPALLRKPVAFTMDYVMAVRAKYEALVHYRYHGDFAAYQERERRKYDTQVVSEAEKEQWLRRVTPKGPSDAYFEQTFPVLLEMARKAAEDGVRLALVDMPTAEWVEGKIPHDAIYQQRMAEIRPELARLGVALIDMRTLSHTDLFCDWAHARPRSAHTFSAFLIQALRREALLP